MLVNVHGIGLCIEDNFIVMGDMKGNDRLPQSYSKVPKLIEAP